jgi:type IV secretory pathway component VirB8
MDVNFDGLRWQLIRSYNRLTKKLNSNMTDGNVRISVEEISDEMEYIRDCIVTLAFMYDEGNFDCLENPQFERLETNEN